MKNVRNTVKTLLLAAVLLLGLLLPATKAQASPTDEIVNFTIQVDVNEDASLEMIYHIEWKVLYDGGGKEKLEWVDLGVPNKYHTNIKPLTDTIKNIKDNGSKLAIYLDRGYSKNETVTFEFSMTQDHMYQIDKWVEGETVYTFTPAWFDDFSVDELVIAWNADQAGAWQPDCLQTDGYLVFTTSLSPGGQYTISVVYPNDTFGFSPDRQADGGGNGYDPGGYNGGNNGGYNGGSDFDGFDLIAGIIGFFVAMGFIIVPIVLVVKFFKYIFSGSGFGTETKTEKKITRTKIEYYEQCPSCGMPREEGRDDCAYCGRSMIKSKEVVEESQIEKPERYTNTGTYRYGDSPNTYIRVNVVNIPVHVPRSGGTRSGGTRSGGGSHHSSCASSCACASHCACASSCACACACASSGRAGCSVKDFFKESIHEGRIAVDSKRKENA